MKNLEQILNWIIITLTTITTIKYNSIKLQRIYKKPKNKIIIIT